MKIFHIAATRNSESSAAWRILQAQRNLGLDAQALVHENRLNQINTLLFDENQSQSRYRSRAKVNSAFNKFSHFGKRALPWSYNFFPAAGIESLKKLEFDILNIHWVPSVIDLDCLSQINKPIVITMHDVWPLTGGCHCNLDCSAWLSGCRVCPQVNNQPIEILTASHQWKGKFNSLGKISNLSVAAPSTWIRKMAESSPIFSGRTVELTPNCVDSKYFYPEPKKIAKSTLGLDPAKKHLMFVVSGNVTQYHKGYDLLHQVVSHFEKFTGNFEVEVLLIGKAKGLPEFVGGNRLIYIGEVTSQEKMRDFYNAADVMISTSRQDNLPNSLIEAIFCGTPVVAFEVGGISDIVKNGENGYLVKLNDTLEMANCIWKVLAGNFDSSKISSYVSSKFSYQNSAESYLRLYEKVLGRKSL